MTNRPPIQAYAGDEYDAPRANRHKEKTPDAKQFGDSREEGNRNTYQGDPLNPIEPQSAENRDDFAVIKVAGLTIAPGILTGGDQPNELVVTMRTPDGMLSFTPAEACALSAALSAVGVFQMESEPRIITRRTEPGQPEHNGLGGGL